MLATVGTDGDIVPFFELGLALKAVGHRVALATHEHFRERAEDGGLEFLPLVSDAETTALLDQPGLWTPLRGPVVIARWGRALMRRQYQRLRDAAGGTPQGTHLVANPGVIAARVLQEETRAPLTTVVLQPWVIPSATAPPVMMGGLSLPSGAPPPVVRIYHRLLDRIGTLLVGGELTRLRRSLHLPPVRRLFRWWHSPDRIIGLFPEWYGPPQPDWPSQLRLAGFPKAGHASPAALPPATQEFLKAGAPPIVFTLGTGMKHAASHFAEGLEACRRLGQRMLIVTSHAEQVPRPLPDWAHHCPFAPFHRLFSQCAAVAHHGGVGTTARALESGRPQLIFPFAFDQLDNACRVERLQAGIWLRRRHRGANRIARALSALLAADPSNRREEIARRMAGEDGLSQAVQMLEETAASPSGHAVRRDAPPPPSAGHQSRRHKVPSRYPERSRDAAPTDRHPGTNGRRKASSKS